MENNTPQEMVVNSSNIFFTISKNKIFQRSLVSIVILGVIISLIVIAKNKYNENLAQKVIQANPFTKKVYTNTPPPSFPLTIVIATSSKLTQSYSKDYSDKTQQTSVVVSSQESVFENFDYYESVMSKDGWNIISKQKGEKKSSLFGLKASSSLEIIIRATVSKNAYTAKTYVVINSYKK